ncbi:MAG: RtcB family protein, partial [Chitinivibrionales bacterium]|nr:RtcB family protein [Chitinivibrionales bacterium]
VIACRDTVIPNAVGVDIGCGMCAVQSDIRIQDLHRDQVVLILNSIKKKIPLGFKHHTSAQKWNGFNSAPDIPLIKQELDSAKCQLGTLGSGNHFIELQKGSDGFVWLMIHSGSRNFGYKIARAYHRIAVEFCGKKKLHLPDRDLAFLPVDSPAAEEYLRCMNFALAFAFENRQRMKTVCTKILADLLKCTFKQEINIHHNFAAIEYHSGKDLIIHRKGATRAHKGEYGIIPGSMGRPSYLVKGRGNPQSFMSCSHGAGRVMGRNEANRSLSIEQVKSAMKGVVFDIPTTGRKNRKVDLSEAPQAYKNIDEVIKSEKDLVEVMLKLEPLGVVKG